MSYFKRDKRAYILLSDGTVFEGYNFGCEGTTIGEIVFTTGMTGYQEVLTDPSYYGQIVLQTYPLIGNYGVNNDDMESEKSWVNGYIVKEWCEEPSNFRTTATINDFLVKQGKIGIWDIDTRALTRKIREFGTMNGAITTEDVYEKREELLEQIRSYKVVNPVQVVTQKKKGWFYTRENRANHVALMDYGYKHNILRMLLQQGCNVTVMPASSTVDDIRRLNPDGIMLSNGPGNPEDNVEIIKNIQDFIAYGKPIFGICLGHQLLALAMGGTTRKMKYGHRGLNQPVKDLSKDRVFITSQNHGYAVESIPEDVGTISHVNMNDGSCEGIAYKNIPAFTVQFHPEASAGPNDTGYLFERFSDLMERGQQGCL
ncbi:carbamoyl-phosphate synthase small chain [Lacrimispora indolis]|uniref:glutamine-hydrolyzing carbamoyl-phosphate synthase small subunit n=1 Tax=Eubacterium callanderi TaxID=53442 RepID=UPI001A99126A|nr:carbamoyl-phosphate synthase small chain [[Clostridium] methoxybenzovorans]